MSESTFLKDPEPVKEPHVHVAIPEGTKLSPAISAALADLSKSLQQASEGVTAKADCLPLHCNLNQCHPYDRKACFVLLTCRIIETE